MTKMKMDRLDIIGYLHDISNEAAHHYGYLEGMKADKSAVDQAEDILEAIKILIKKLEDDEVTDHDWNA